MMSGQPQPDAASTLASPTGGASPRKAGAFLVLTALLTALSVVGRVSAQADQASLEESLDAISLHSGLYGLGGAARLLSGVTLLLGGWLLLNSWIIRMRLGSPLVPGLLVVSGIFTAVSGASAVILAVTAPEMSSLVESSALIRWLSGKIGFALAGVALMIASRYQWRVGRPLRHIAPASALVGAAMQFIWIDSATMVHPVVGAAFFLWLLAVGLMLTAGRTERLFLRMLNSPSP